MKNAGKIEDPLTHKIIGCPEKTHRLHRFTQIIKKNKKNLGNLCNLWANFFNRLLAIAHSLSWGTANQFWSKKP
jgi:hypothetical protein